MSIQVQTPRTSPHPLSYNKFHILSFFFAFPRFCSMYVGYWFEDMHSIRCRLFCHNVLPINCDMWYRIIFIFYQKKFYRTTYISCHIISIFFASIMLPNAITVVLSYPIDLLLANELNIVFSFYNNFIMT